LAKKIIKNSTSPILEESIKSADKLLKLMKHPRIMAFLFRHVLNRLIVNKQPKWAVKLRTTFLKLGGGYVNHLGISALRYGAMASNEGTKIVYNAFKNNEPIAWIDWMIPMDIVKAFGYKTWCPTNPFAMHVAQGPGGGAHYVSVSEEVGISEDFCSVNKSSLGAFFGGEVPPPSVCIHGSHPCDSARMQNMLFEHYFPDVPSYTMNTAYGRTPEELDRWVESTWGLIRFLEKTTGREMDWNYLEQSARRIDRFNRAMNESSELQRSIPAPPLPNYLAVLWRWRLSEAGSENLTKSAEMLRDTAQWYVDYYKRKKTPREKIRVLIADQNVVWTEFGVWMYKNFGAKVVMDYIARSSFPPIDFSSRESLVRTLAIEKLYLSMIRQSHGNVDLNIEETASLIEEYQVDCVIFNNHAGCKHNAALRKMLSDTCRSAGVPSLFLDLDIVDSRHVGVDEIHSKIKNFLHSHGLI